MPPPTPWTPREKRTLRRAIALVQKSRSRRTEGDPSEVYRDSLLERNLRLNGVYYRQGTRMHHFVLLLREPDEESFKLAFQVEQVVQKRFPDQTFDFSVKSSHAFSTEERANLVASGYKPIEVPGVDGNPR